MTENAVKSYCYSKREVLLGIEAYAIVALVTFIVAFASTAGADEALQKCSIPGAASVGTVQQQTSDTPTCGIEMTCTDRPVQLGYSDGVCFRATCPGIWALIHKRVDQASFRRRFISYRHYGFRGAWELKDQGVIESGVAPIRELFLVLPDDLIEIKLRDPDCNSVIEVTNLGYIKRGTISELKQWLAYNVYLERPERVESVSGPRNGSSICQTAPTRWQCLRGGMLSRIISVGRCIGLPFCP